MTTPNKSQAQRMAEAHLHMPQGVAENYRYWGEEQTVFVKHVQGCRITDCDDREFVDFRLGYGPIILGYRDDRVDRVVMHAIQELGTISGFSTLLDVEVVKGIKALCPNIDKVRFANSGTEAVMGALRTARGWTGRDRVVIVEGGFHGLTDEMMWKSDVEGWDAETQSAPRIVPFGAGIPSQTRGLVDFIPLNDHQALQKLFDEKGEQIAAVLLEPIMGNCGSISATPAWLQTLLYEVNPLDGDVASVRLHVDEGSDRLDGRFVWASHCVDWTIDPRPFGVRLCNDWRQLAKANPQGNFFVHPDEGVLADPFAEVNAFHHSDRFAQWFALHFGLRTPQMQIFTGFPMTNAFFGDFDDDGKRELAQRRLSAKRTHEQEKKRSEKRLREQLRKRRGKRLRKRRICSAVCSVLQSIAKRSSEPGLMLKMVSIFLSAARRLTPLGVT